LPYFFIGAGLIGLFASFELTIQSMAVLSDPDYIPPCNISPFLSCSAVMDSWQSTLFGFPNSLLGVVGFPIIVTIGFALLAGAQFKRWFWLGAQMGVTVAVAFVYWFFYQSAFVTNSLCPWCLVFWSVTIPLFWYTTVYNLQESHIRTPRSLAGANAVINKHPHLPLLLLYGVIILTILIRFWPYWSTLF
jgi:uncharacterized membrane protein